MRSSRRSRAVIALFVSLATARAAGAACTAGAFLLRVPEDCATIPLAVTAAGNGATIDIAAGTYTFTTNPLNLDGLSKSITFAARQLRAVTFKSTSTSGIVRIVNANDGSNGRPMVFEGIRFVDGASATSGRAGGVTLTAAEASFVDCDFENNAQTHATSGGGALGLYGGSRAVVVRSNFDGNSAKNQGGAIYALLQVDRGRSSVWVIGSSFDGNTTAESGFNSTSAGGAIYIRTSDLRVADSRFVNNRAGFAGGAIYAIGAWADTEPYCNYSAPTADVLLTHLELSGNAADDTANAAAVARTFGGAVHVEDCTRARLYASLVEGNEADWGGAVSLDHARIEIEQSVFRDNRSTVPDGSGQPVGGAIASFSSDNTSAAEDRPSGSLTIDRTLFAGAVDESATAQLGGCLIVAGDVPRFNQDGMQAGYPSPVDLTDSVLFGCAVDFFAGSTVARGGALEMQLVDQNWDGVLLARNRADGDGGSNGSGGGASLWYDTESDWSDVVFSGNSAEHTEPDLFLQDSGSTPSGSYDTWSSTSASPAGGILIAAPSRIAAGAWPFDGEAWLGFGWSGASATLDGGALALDPKNGLVPGAPGAHTLAVASLGSCARCADDVDAPPAPLAELTATPGSISTAQSSLLEWETTSATATFLTSVVDRGVGIDGTASGTASVSPDGSVTYRYLAFTSEGGALAERRLFVSEPVDPDEPIFVSNFELEYYGWSSVTP